MVLKQMTLSYVGDGIKNVNIFKFRLFNFSHPLNEETNSSNLSDEETGWCTNRFLIFLFNSNHGFTSVEI